MTSDVLHFVLRFYLPLLVGIALIILVVANPTFLAQATGSPLEGEVRAGLLVISVPLRLQLKRAVVVRIVLLAMAAASIFVAMSTNFAEYFPPRLNMNVFFDVTGIESTLTQLPASAFDSVAVAPNWRDLIAAYDSEVKRSIGQLWGQERGRRSTDVKAIDRSMMHATGTTSFIVSRVGPLSYHVDSANGQLQFGFDIAHQRTISFSSQFHLRETPSNHVRPSFWTLVKSASITIRPEFKQVFFIQDAAADAAFDHIVIGLTQVTILPFPRLSNTLYLWRMSDGRIVPVAYAVYY